MSAEDAIGADLFGVGIVLLIIITAFLIGRWKAKHPKPEPFNPDDFVEVERPEEPQEPKPAVTLEDMPLAQVFRINREDPLDRFADWALQSQRTPQVPLENFYMSIVEEYGKSWVHPFIPGMDPRQWVRILAPNYDEARKIAYHYSGGHYAIIQNERQFRDVRDIIFTRGEYDLLDSNSYWAFQDSEAID